MGGMNRAGWAPFLEGKFQIDQTSSPDATPQKKGDFYQHILCSFFFGGGVLLRKRALKGGTPLDSHDIKAARILCCFMFFFGWIQNPPNKTNLLLRFGSRRWCWLPHVTEVQGIAS